MWGKRRDPKTDWTQENFYQSAIDMPRAGLPAVRTIQRRIALWRWVIIANLVLAPLAFLTVLTLPNVLAAQDSDTSLDMFEQSRPVAISGVQTWLASDPEPPIAGARFVSWDSATREEQALDEGSSRERSVLIDVHRMTVAAPDRLFTVSARVAVSDELGATMLGSPAIELVAHNTELAWPDIPLWPGVSRGNTTPNVDQAIQTWMGAFGGTDPVALQQVVGDPNTTATYIPLAGAYFSQLNVGQVGAIWTGKRKQSEEPDRLIVNITMSLSWGSEPEDGFTRLPTVSYDVLVDKANTASPQVVAWGAPGTGHLLEPYMNAVLGKTVNLPTPDTPLPQIENQDNEPDGYDREQDGETDGY